MFENINLTNEQSKAIEEYLKNPNSNYPLVIISTNEFFRNYLLDQICEKQHWKIISAQDLANDIIQSRQRNSFEILSEQLVSQPALIISELDFFKHRELTQRDLTKIILKCRNPVVLTAKSVDGFSYDIREILSHSTIITL